MLSRLALALPLLSRDQQGRIKLESAAVSSIRVNFCCPEQMNKLRSIGLQFEADMNQVVTLLVVQIPPQGELARGILHSDGLQHGRASPLRDVARPSKQHMRVRMLRNRIPPTSARPPPLGRPSEPSTLLMESTSTRSLLGRTNAQTTIHITRNTRVAITPSGILRARALHVTRVCYGEKTIRTHSANLTGWLCSSDCCPVRSPSSS